jgi:hypothetical protein
VEARLERPEEADREDGGGAVLRTVSHGTESFLRRASSERFSGR